MRVRKYQMRDTDMMISIWNEAVDACEPLPAEGVIDLVGGNAFFAGQSYCGVAVDFGANVHGFYILNAEYHREENPTIPPKDRLQTRRSEAYA